MDHKIDKIKVVLITGGTSGLGLEMVKLFLSKGYFVVATGRQPVIIQGYEEKFILARTDFSDLHQTAVQVHQLCEKYNFDIVINNAGVLSPPYFTLTKDKLEYSFQVNFLAHLLINEIIIKNTPADRLLTICSVISPVYRIAKTGVNLPLEEPGYKPFKAYTDSKFYLALTGRMLSERYPGRNIICVSFNPGTFSSGIYRMQGRLFKRLYKIASPFMRKPSKVAKAIYKTLNTESLERGAIYDIGKKVGHLPEAGLAIYDPFWIECYEKIGSV